MTSANNVAEIDTSMRGREVAFLRVAGPIPSELNIPRAREAGATVYRCVCQAAEGHLWFVCYDVQGREVRRYNAAHVTTVEWE